MRFATLKPGVVVPLSLVAFLAQPRPDVAVGAFEGWNPNAGEDLEFGITSTVLGEQENAPWAFEGGYNGAYWFDRETALGQTFTVPSDRELESISVRISAGNGTTGTFEVAVHEFDPLTSDTTLLVASATGDASDYGYDLSSVPVSAFDVSAAGATLHAGTTYMLAFRGTESSAGNFFVQAAVNIYADGSVHLGQWIPPGPDLTGSWTVKRSGARTSGTLRIENAGSDPAEATYIVGIYRSDDGSTPGKRLDTLRFPKRRTSWSKDYAVRFRTPASGFVLAKIDPDDRIPESDESNNVVILYAPSMEDAAAAGD
ncbi:MAG: hypothetical protein HMLKMBBP_00025 [Planctomycetes bacterium]|nr:hypothetical protein [Planctomycetota bacterium]